MIHVNVRRDVSLVKKPIIPIPSATFNGVSVFGGRKSAETVVMMTNAGNIPVAA